MKRSVADGKTVSSEVCWFVGLLVCYLVRSYCVGARRFPMCTSALESRLWTVNCANAIDDWLWLCACRWSRSPSRAPAFSALCSSICRASSRFVYHYTSIHVFTTFTVLLFFHSFIVLQFLVSGTLTTLTFQVPFSEFPIQIHIFLVYIDYTYQTETSDMATNTRETIQQLCREHMKNPNAIILCIQVFLSLHSTIFFHVLPFLPITKTL